MVFLPPPITPAGGAKDAAGPASEDYWPSRKGQLTLVADFHVAVA
jgi:hypothetical protein